MLPQQFGFLADPPKNRRVPAFETNHRFPREGQIDEQLIDMLLLHRVAVGSFADVDLLRSGFRPLQQAGIGQTIVNDDVAFLQAIEPLERNQSRISRACANQINFTGHSRSLPGFL